MGKYNAEDARKDQLAGILSEIKNSASRGYSNMCIYERDIPSSDILIKLNQLGFKTEEVAKYRKHPFWTLKHRYVRISW